MQKTILMGAAGLIGSTIAAAFGGWDTGLQALLIFMGLDYVLGLTLACLRKSTKSESGGLSSKSAWLGLLRKVGTLAMIVVAVQLDVVLGSTFVRDGVVIAYIVNEAISLIENAGLLGVPIPKVLQRAIDVLTKTADKEDD